VKESQLSETLHKILYPRNPEELGLIVAGLGSAVALVWYIIRKRRPSAEEMERRRRAGLAATGRIIDGVIVDAPTRETGQADEQAESGPALIVFKYRIAGVVYECSQDVSALQTEIEAFRVDLPVSIKYDPRNPANSIVVSESWSGLRTGAETTWQTGRSGTNAPSM
jgi:hypothetical protein